MFDRITHWLAVIFLATMAAGSVWSIILAVMEFLSGQPYSVYAGIVLLVPVSVFFLTVWSVWRLLRSFPSETP